MASSLDFIESPLALKLSQRDVLSRAEERILEEAIGRVAMIEPGQDLVREGDHQTESCLLLDGWTCRYKMIADGKRQITAFNVPGDFVDLHSLLLSPMDHSILTLTLCRVAFVPHSNLREITANNPHLTRLLWLSTLIDAAIHREWIATLGRRPAAQRIAHLLCELFLRLQTVGRIRGQGFRLPVTQATLCDALGISAVHTNRSIQHLRREGMVSWKGEDVEIHDWQRLVDFAGFDATYLNLEFQPR
jgi:CRP-like cAMP-binding protein